MNKEDARVFWKAIMAVAGKLQDRASEAYRAQLVGMTYNQLRMIKLVYALNQDFVCGVTLKILAEHLQITPAAASEMVDSLVRKNLLTREHSPVDRRAVSIRLSDQTLERFFAEERRFDDLAESFLAGCSGEEGDAAIKIVDAFSKYVQKL